MTSAERPIPRGGVLDINAYVPGRSEAPGAAKVFKLSSNETPLGPSPKAIEAYRAAAASLADYPDGASTALRQAIGKAFGLDPARIVCGTGSDELLNLLAQAYLSAGDEAISTKHGFLVYRNATLAAGGKPVVAEERNFTADVDAILKLVSARTRVIFFANPNNPTGTYSAVLGSAAAARGLAFPRAPRDRRGLCRLCPPQRLRVGHRARRRPATTS